MVNKDRDSDNDDNDGSLYSYLKESMKEDMIVHNKVYDMCKSELNYTIVKAPNSIDFKLYFPNSKTFIVISNMYYYRVSNSDTWCLIIIPSDSILATKLDYDKKVFVNDDILKEIIRLKNLDTIN